MTFKKEGSRQSRQRKLCNLEQVRRGCRLGAAKCWLQDTVLRDTLVQWYDVSGTVRSFGAVSHC